MLINNALWLCQLTQKSLSPNSLYDTCTESSPHHTTIHIHHHPHHITIHTHYHPHQGSGKCSSLFFSSCFVLFYRQPSTSAWTCNWSAGNASAPIQVSIPFFFPFFFQLICVHPHSWTTTSTLVVMHPHPPPSASIPSSKFSLFFFIYNHPCLISVSSMSTTIHISMICVPTFTSPSHSISGFFFSLICI